jgi:GH15 family glucan-1,4-alpha-glucosidase
MRFLADNWREPDEGIWEVRGGRRHFTHSKMMVWVAVDRAIRTVEECGLDGPVDEWRLLREEVHADVCTRGYDAERGVFIQAYGAKELDASLLLMVPTGFLPPTDARVRRTVEAIERELTHDGFVLRYQTRSGVDGLPPGEGAFLACSFWLVSALAAIGRRDDAVARFERLLSLRNDIGLLSEEYDVAGQRLIGNFPQALSHLSLVNSAYDLTAGDDHGTTDRTGPRQRVPHTDRDVDRV